MFDDHCDPPMTEKKDVLAEAKKVIDIEIDGLLQVKDNIDESFVDAVDLIIKAKGRVVVTGIGKSGLIGRKIAATLASTGTPSIFLHPVEAMHGDLGMVAKDDVILAISNSGETQELNALLPVFKERNIPIIAMTGNMNSTLAKASQAIINTRVEKEACSLGLAPTASTTATLAAGDALAVVLLNMHQFNEQDFRRNHPGGSLGERLKVQVRQVMLTGSKVPLARLGMDMAEVLKEMDRKGLGAVLVLDGDESLVGIVTDGDLRRGLIRFGKLDTRKVEEVMTTNPKSIPPHALALDALSLMERYLITVLPVVGDDCSLLGIVHLHDLLGKGQFRFSV